MKIKTAKTIGVIIGTIVALILGCGVIKLVTMCFGWTFSWAIATWIYLIVCLAKHIFSHNTTVEK